MSTPASELSTLSAVSKDKLVSDLRVVVADAEEILKATASQAGEKAAELREKISARLRDAKLRLADAEAALADKTKAAARVTDDFVHAGQHLVRGDFHPVAPNAPLGAQIAQQGTVAAAQIQHPFPGGDPVGDGVEVKTVDCVIGHGRRLKP